MGLFDSFWGGTTSTGADGHEYNSQYGVMTSGFRNCQMHDSDTNIDGTNINEMVNQYRARGATESQISDFIGRLDRKYNR